MVFAIQARKFGRGCSRVSDCAEGLVETGGSVRESVLCGRVWWGGE